MPPRKRKTLIIKRILIFLQTILLMAYASFAHAELSCLELVKQLENKRENVDTNGGIWGYFEKNSFLRKRSAEALQLDSRINKIFFILNYLCETKNGIPLNDLAIYISRNLTGKSEDVFKAELLVLGKTSQQIDNWFNFYRYAQNHRLRTLENSTIRNTINESTSLIKSYARLAKNISRVHSPELLLQKTRILVISIDHFLANDPYITQALEEISHVPYWDINESTGGS